MHQAYLRRITVKPDSEVSGPGLRDELLIRRQDVFHACVVVRRERVLSRALLGQCSCMRYYPAF